MHTEEHIELAEKHGAHNYHPLPIVISKAERVWVEDPEGNKYMDMLSAYSAVNQGHRHPRIINALVEQAGKVTLTSRAFHNDKMGIFLKKVNELCEMEKTLPMNTGAEAVETAIKTARKWGYKKKGVPEGKAEIICMHNNFHGRTTTIVGFSSEEQYKDGFGPFTPGFKLVKYGDILELEEAITENTVAIMAEPIQGEAGIIIPPEGFLKKIRDLCDKNNMLMILDEVQTGLCRTGKLFAYQHEGVKPDMLILGKALGGGVFPVSAVVSSNEIMGVYRPGDHGSTFGGNPLACAVGIASIDVLLDEKLADRSNELGEWFMAKLRTIESPYIKEVRGKGLLIGVELNTKARPFCEKLMEKGILAKETHDKVIRFAPPLIITKEELDWAFERIKEVLK
ncbi:MAG: ornithine--oxo-acid transaminase [Candidatus Coatesbacteria bacterium]|nr:ornithine--oxo-acid transaminase [Candidatus Coatesbacteria bacterium]